VSYTDRGDHEANQGDIFAGVRFEGFEMDGMITAHDCVCDKFLAPRTSLTAEAQDSFVVAVAPVHPVSELTGDRSAHVRRHAMPRYFYLEAADGRDELVADLYLEQPVRFIDLLRCHRIASLSDATRARLWQQFMRLRLGEDYMKFLKELVDAS